MNATHVVYWTSAYASKNPGMYTPVTQSNSSWFENAEKAAAFREKLVQLKATNGTYRGRLVTHVGHVEENQ